MIGGKQLFIFTHDPKIETAAAAATNTMPAADLDSLAVYELEQAIEMAEAFFLLSWRKSAVAMYTRVTNRIRSF